MNESESRRLRRECLDLRQVDSTKLLWHIRRKSVSKSKFADEMHIGRTSLYRMLEGQPVKHETIEQVARSLNIDVAELLISDSGECCFDSMLSPWDHPEWEIVPGTQLPLEAMSNGLILRIAKVRHRRLQGEFGRAKIYDITGMSSAVRQQCHQALTRHALVCRQLKNNPHFPVNLTMTAQFDDSVWTTVDQWIDGESLAIWRSRERLTGQTILKVMSDVAQAVGALHRNQIVARELCPKRILTSVDQGSTVVTDLELSKLMSFRGTVSAEWQTNHYRAPEISGGQSRCQADLFSLARIWVFLLAGHLPEFPEDKQTVLKHGYTAELTQFIVRSLSPSWRKRPVSVNDLFHLITLQSEVAPR